MWLTPGTWLAVLVTFCLGGCTADTLPDGRPAPPNYYIHKLGLEGGGG
jgi:hypothetical protein